MESATCIKTLREEATRRGKTLAWIETPGHGLLFTHCKKGKEKETVENLRRAKYNPYAWGAMDANGEPVTSILSKKKKSKKSVKKRKKARK